jgi:hypothetical protein
VPEKASESPGNHFGISQMIKEALIRSKISRENTFYFADYRRGPAGGCHDSETPKKTLIPFIFNNKAEGLPIIARCA